MKNIYFKPHIKRKSEKAFFDYLHNQIENSTHIKQNFELPEVYIDKLINTIELLYSIEACKYVRDNKKRIIRDHLLKLPNKIKVGRNISDVSVDIVIEENGNLTFIEFHEKQHSNLSDSRMRPIFSPEGERYEIPRFLQRLIKDLWRWRYLTNFKIVWQNWFEKNQKKPIIFIMKQNEEFVLQDRFAISSIE